MCAHTHAHAVRRKGTRTSAAAIKAEAAAEVRIVVLVGQISGVTGRQFLFELLHSSALFILFGLLPGANIAHVARTSRQLLGFGTESRHLLLQSKHLVVVATPTEPHQCI